MSLRVHPMMPIELQLQRHGFRQIELSPAYAYLHPDGSSLVFWRDPEKTAAEIRRFSTHDASEFLALMKVVFALRNSGMEYDSAHIDRYALFAPGGWRRFL